MYAAFRAISFCWPGVLRFKSLGHGKLPVSAERHPFLPFKIRHWWSFSSAKPRGVPFDLPDSVWFVEFLNLCDQNYKNQTIGAVELKVIIQQSLIWQQYFVLNVMSRLSINNSALAEIFLQILYFKDKWSALIYVQRTSVSLFTPVKSERKLRWKIKQYKVLWNKWAWKETRWTFGTGGLLVGNVAFF